MNARLLSKLLSTAILSAGLIHGAQADVVITEWMYSGNGGEFIEFTNLGNSAVDFTGWSYDDNSAIPGVFDLSGFGLVAAGESVVITEDPAATFRADWNLGAGVKVLGDYTNNIGRGDQINLYDGVTLIDRLTYDDETIGGPRTKDASGVAKNAAALGADDATQWQLAALGDFENSYLSAKGDIGSPGFTSYAAPVPEADTYALMLAGLGLVGFMARRRGSR
ncbi:MAG: lamin tail domain-containing protein [Thiobacillus sp.]|nr:lamin tail domain-containing protein [Thiobacillus sp.]